MDHRELPLWLELIGWALLAPFGLAVLYLLGRRQAELVNTAIEEATP